MLLTSFYFTLSRHHNQSRIFRFRLRCFCLVTVSSVVFYTVFISVKFGQIRIFMLDFHYSSSSSLTIPIPVWTFTVKSFCTIFSYGIYSLQYVVLVSILTSYYKLIYACISSPRSFRSFCM